MPDNDISRTLDWRFRVGELGRDGRDVRLQAKPQQCEVLARALDVPACHELRLEGRLKPLSRGRCRLAGKVSARLTQTCVVTLEPLHARVEKVVDLEFWPEPDIAAQASASFDALGDEDPEPLDGDVADLGRLAFEVVGAGLDPFPRKADAAFDWQDPGMGKEAKPNPFAMLEKLKQQRPGGR